MSRTSVRHDGQVGAGGRGSHERGRSGVDAGSGTGWTMGAAARTRLGRLRVYRPHAAICVRHLYQIAGMAERLPADLPLGVDLVPTAARVIGHPERAGGVDGRLSGSAAERNLPADGRQSRWVQLLDDARRVVDDPGRAGAGDYLKGGGGPVSVLVVTTPASSRPAATTGRCAGRARRRHRRAVPPRRDLRASRRWPGRRSRRCSH